MLTALIIVSVVAYVFIGYFVQDVACYQLDLLEDAEERWVVGIMWPVVVILVLALLVNLICLAVGNCWKRFRQFRNKRKRQKEGS